MKYRSKKVEKRHFRGIYVYISPSLLSASWGAMQNYYTSELLYIKITIRQNYSTSKLLYIKITIQLYVKITIHQNYYTSKLLYFINQQTNIQYQLLDIKLLYIKMTIHQNYYTLLINKRLYNITRHQNYKTSKLLYINIFATILAYFLINNFNIL